ncbi:MAG: DUF1674 domain-containing protein [Geminicoccaceae bacterium]
MSERKSAEPIPNDAASLTQGGEARPGDREAAPESRGAEVVPEQPAGERNGPSGPEPTRFGDWEKGGRCFDF